MTEHLKELAGKIADAASALESLLQDAATELESVDLPEPYELWDEAKAAADAASADLSISEDITDTIVALERAAKVMK